MLRLLLCLIPFSQEIMRCLSSAKNFRRCRRAVRWGTASHSRDPDLAPWTSENYGIELLAMVRQSICNLGPCGLLGAGKRLRATSATS